MQGDENILGWLDQVVEEFKSAGATAEESEPEADQTQQAHEERLKALPGEIRDYIPQWQQDSEIEGEVTLKLLLNARCLIKHGKERGSDAFFKEEMEALLELMKSNDAELVKKVRELLGIDAEPEPESEQDTPDKVELRRYF